MKNQSKIVLISGANRGVGKAITDKLYEDGYSLSLGARNLEQLTQNTTNYDPERYLCSFYEAKQKQTAIQWVESTMQKYGRIDALINNAGIHKMNQLEQYNEKNLDELWEVNVKAPLYLISRVYPILKEGGGGKVINIVSLSGKRIKGISFDYAMSKFALNALTHAVRYQGWEDGIRATAICPGWVNTDMVSELSQGIIKPQDMTQPEDLAKIISLLLSLPANASVAELCVNCVLESSY